jgi:hypothetical protein
MLFSFRLSFFLLLSLALNSGLAAQSFGGHTTYYTIISKGMVLNADQQLILKRGFYHYDWDEDYTSEASSAYGFGYGLESFHLEFNSAYPIQLKRVNKRKAFQRREYYFIQITDADGVIYEWREIPIRQVYEVSGQQGEKKVYAYSINLHGIPMTILQKAQRIEILKIREF